MASWMCLLRSASALYTRMEIPLQHVYCSWRYTRDARLDNGAAIPLSVRSNQGARRPRRVSKRGDMTRQLTP